MKAIETQRIEPITCTTKNKPHLTALSRKTLSGPIKKAISMVDDSCSILDYGSGKGSDVELLNKQGFNAQGFDPYYQDSMPPGSFDLVFCSFVLNVIEDLPTSRLSVVKDALSRVAIGGRYFIAVRTDKEIAYCSKGKWTPHLDGFISRQFKDGSYMFQKGFNKDELTELVKQTGLNVTTKAAGSGSFIFITGTRLA